jgi:hypothetical protein
MGSSQSNENEQSYWTGPYSVKVHMSIQAVVDTDGYNILYKNGFGSKRVSPITPINMSESIYKEKYAELRDNGQYYYKGVNKNCEDFWIGPYKVRIHVFIPYVVAEDGFNTFYKDGSVSKIKMLQTEIMNENTYKYEHCKLMNDGHYYYYK